MAMVAICTKIWITLETVSMAMVTICAKIWITLETVSMAMVAMERIPSNHCCGVAMEGVDVILI